MTCIIGQALFIQICLKQCMYELYYRSRIVHTNMFKAVHV